ncbi:hypothetical protein TWF696_003807 [Orbilia brochopaga]|uniref:Nucleoside phosphorylase domain-containing protein n=1 Tax=Orbilia brochopaga TaxID=3140254 RepID=A0AAV9V486_9PEZI
MSNQKSPSPSPEDFEVTIICALATEYNAICLLFDEVWDQDAGDLKYKAGRIGMHKVVLARLSGMGKASAASTATTIQKDYPKVRLAFLVGICGGVPRHGDQEILLGDVVISSGIIQYDFGKQYPGNYSTKDSLKHHSTEKLIRNQLCMLENDDDRDDLQEMMARHLKTLQAKAEQKQRGERYKYLGAANDKLFKSHYRHKHRILKDSECATCDNGLDTVCEDALTSDCERLHCDEENLVPRKRLERLKNLNGESAHEPFIHVGLVGSGDTVIKSGEHRDGLAKFGKMIAFEMEGAGISEVVQCIVVKGVCDYADSHKNKSWQNFAAAMAASALKAILETFPLFNRRRDGIQSPPQSPPKTQTVQLPIISTKASASQDQERIKRVRDVQRKLPALVQDISRDLTRKLEWTPYLSAAPAAICVMATCLVAGSSSITGSIEVNLPALDIKGITIKPNKYLGTNLQYCSDLGKKAFSQAEGGMKKLQNLAEFVTGRTGPLAQIVLVLNDTKPEFSSLEMWMKELANAAATCQDEASLMKSRFEGLLEFIIELRRATIEALHANKQQLSNEEKAVKGKYALQVQRAEEEKIKLERELDEAKQNLQVAQEKMKSVLKANPCERSQVEINEIDSELRKIEQCEPSSWTVFGLFFGDAAKRVRKTQDKRKRDLLAKRKDLVTKRDESINHDQTCAVNDFEACQSRVGEAEQRLRQAQDNHTALMKQQFQSVKAFDTACEDLSKLSDKTLDLKAINQILLRSIRALRDLNNYIDKMSNFFLEVSRYVDDTMELRLSQFKKQTGDIEKRATSRTEEENNRHKTSAIMTALDLHGRFTLIHNIAGVYVDVSKKHITPGVKMMEGLTYLDDDDYEEEMAGFKKWGEKAVAEIEALATETNAKIRDAVFNNIASLARKQIGIEDTGDAYDSEDS